MNTKLLSIDYDFFQNATAAEQAILYPDGHDFADTSLRNYIWTMRYRTTPMLSGIKTNEDLLNAMLKTLSNQKKDTPVTIKNSHVFAYQTIMSLYTTYDIPINVYHIDMHHDMFNDSPIPDKVDCGNWLLIAKEQGYVNDITWFKRKASDELCPIEKNMKTKPDVVYCDTLEQLKNVQFDSIFICRSDMWSAPHLDNGFQKIIDLCKNHFINVSIEKAITSPRPQSIYKPKGET